MRSTAPRTVVRRPKGPENKWTPEEDEVLAAAVNASGFKVCWRKIASSLPGRTNKSCRKRWIHSLDPTLKKGRWTAQEDKVLLNAIKTHGTLWYKVAKHLPGRTDDQAAKRFREKLDPSIARTPWSDEEDEILIRMWKKVGKRWNLISRELNGRPAVHCRNRWQSLLRIGKVDGSEQGLDFDYTLCGVDAIGEDDDDVLSSPIEPDMLRPSTASSSSSSASSSHILTPLRTARTLAPADRHLYSSKEEEEEINFPIDPLYQSFQSPRALPGMSGFYNSMMDSGPQRLLRTDPYAVDDSPFQFSMSPPQQSPSKPNMFMVPHPNMRLLSGPTPYPQQNISDARDEPLFPFNFGQPPLPSSPPFYPSYGTTPSNFQQMPTQHMVGQPPVPVSRPPSIRLPQIQTSNLSHENNFMMTCPLVHCGFQSTNLIELWKHVTWDHVSPPSMPDSTPHDHALASSRPPRFDLSMTPEFGTMKMDPAMIDYVERAILELDPEAAASQAYHESVGAGYGMGLQMEDFDVGLGRLPLHIPTTA